MPSVRTMRGRWGAPSALACALYALALSACFMAGYETPSNDAASDVQAPGSEEDPSNSGTGARDAADHSRDAGDDPTSDSGSFPAASDGAISTPLRDAGMDAGFRVAMDSGLDAGAQNAPDATTDAAKNDENTAADATVEASATCQGQASCAPSCTASPCNLDCADSGTCNATCRAGETCEVDCYHTLSCNVTCQAGSDCTVRCVGEGDCHTTCAVDAGCTNICLTGASCPFQKCGAGAAKNCGTTTSCGRMGCN